MNGADDRDSAQHRWQTQLAEWAIPDHIRKHASDDPWHLDPSLFRPADQHADAAPSLATERALALLGEEQSVLDVGCGGGAAAFALVPPARQIHGVDQSGQMLEVFASVATERSVPYATTIGSWLDVSRHFDADSFDVVVCHHVAYNVANLGPFVGELSRVARNGVVMELTMAHPQSSNNPLWQAFWELTRPVGPTALDAAAAITEHLANEGNTTTKTQLEVGHAVATRQEPAWESRVNSALRMLCLSSDRFDDVAEAVQTLPARSSERAVIVVS